MFSPVLKLIVADPLKALAEVIACDSEPEPVAFALETLKVCADAVTGRDAIKSINRKDIRIACYLE